MSFGVVVSDIEAMVIGSTIDATSAPSTTQVEDWIETASGVGAGIYQMKGLDPTTYITPGTPGYSYGRRAVILEVAAQLMYALQGSFEQAESLSAKAEKMWSRLEDFVGILGNDAQSGFGAVDMPFSTANQALKDAIADNPSTLRTKMIRANKM